MYVTSPGARPPKLVTFSRDLTIAGGFSITGAGAKPKAFLMFGTVDNAPGYATWGFADNSLVVGALDKGSTEIRVTAMFYVQATVGYHIWGVASFDADGITFSDVISGIPAGTFEGKILLFF